MTGARITVKVEGIGAGRERLRALIAAGHDATPLMRDIGEGLLNSTRERFRTEAAPDGKPWAPLSEVTRKRKRRNKDRILTHEGHLGGTSLNYRAGPTEVLVGSTSVYAGTHQFGARTGAYGRTERGGPIPWGDIPARPFLGVSEADREMIEESVLDHFSKL